MIIDIGLRLPDCIYAWMYSSCQKFKGTDCTNFWASNYAFNLRRVKHFYKSSLAYRSVNVVVDFNANMVTNHPSNLSHNHTPQPVFLYVASCTTATPFIAINRLLVQLCLDICPLPLNKLGYNFYWLHFIYPAFN